MIPVPSFSEYERAAKAANCKIKYLATHSANNFNIYFDELIEVIRAEDINCVVLANPNNPTGNLLESKNIIELLENIEFVVIDESFVDFLGDDYSIRQLTKSFSNLVVVQSLTKFFAIPGLRLGFAIADESIINRLELGKDVWNVNYLAQKAGVAALDDVEYINETQRWIAAEKDYIINRLHNIEVINFFEPTVNFVLIKFKTEETALNVIDTLKSHKILVRSCANFLGLDGSYIRMAIRNREENCKVLDVLERLQK